MKKTTLLMLTVLITSTITAQTTIWSDDFEAAGDWELANAGYTFHDLDGLTTYNLNWYAVPGNAEVYTGVSIVWNSSAVTTDTSPDTTLDDPHQGSKGLYFVAGNPDSGSASANDDWIITPQIDLTSFVGAEFSFWAKSLRDDFGLEQFEVAISTTGTDPGDFTIISGGSPEEAPVTYTQYSYDLSAYDGMQIYLAIHYVSADIFILQLDEFLVQEPALSVDDFEQTKIEHSFNQATKVLSIESQAVLNTISVYNVLGQETLNQKLNDVSANVNMSEFQSGIYIVRISDSKNASKTFKLLVK